MNKIIVYKTHEVPKQLWETIVEGFNDCFPEHKKNVKEFIERYETNPIGYCYHALYFDDNVLGGFNSITPMRYLINNEEVVLGQSGDTFILPEYRKDMLLFKKIYDELKKACAKDGIVAFLGVPNPNSYRYSTKILHCKEIMQLNYWILPIKIGNVLKKYKWSNYISPLYFYTVLFFNGIYTAIYNSREEQRSIHVKIDNEFLNRRFQANHYVDIKDGSQRFIYTITNDEGIRCAYLMYFGEDGFLRTSRSLYKCLRYIRKNENIDMIMFCGLMNMKQFMLTKVPARFEPRTLHFTVDILKNEHKEKYNSLLDSKVWEYSLLNLDVR